MAAITSMVLGGIATGLNVYGQVQAAKGAEEAAEYNAQIAENAATRSEQEQQETASRQRIEKRRAMAQARAKLSASGAALGQGSTMDFMEVMDSRLETQIQDSARTAALEARAMRQNANLSRYQGQQQSSALKIKSFGTLLEGGSRLGGQISNYRDRTKKNTTSLGNGY